MKKRSIIVVLSLLILVLGVALVPVMAQDEEMEITEPALVFDAPEGYESVEVLGDFPDNARLEMDAEAILLVGPDAYAQVIAEQEFESDDDALGFYMGRAGYSVGDPGDVSHDNVLAVARIALARRQQTGQAYLVDLGVGLRGVVVSLHTGRGRVGAPGGDVDVVLNSIAYPMDIVQAAATEGSFTTLVAALKLLGLIWHSTAKVHSLSLHPMMQHLKHSLIHLALQQNNFWQQIILMMSCSIMLCLAVWIQLLWLRITSTRHLSQRFYL